jgi:hypothetical protein
LTGLPSFTNLLIQFRTLPEVAMAAKLPPKPKPLIGWREWVGLPDLGVAHIKAKIDTGARSSSLHTFDVEEFQRDGQTWVRFHIFPRQRCNQTRVWTEAAVLEHRDIRSSNGQMSSRPVICTRVLILGKKYRIDLTLADRSEMGFRMLLGREAVRRRFVIDPGHSFLGGVPPKASHPEATAEHQESSPS